MATVLGKSPPPFNRNDITGSVKSISDYLIYLHENIDYQLGQLKRTDTETAKKLEELGESLEAMNSSISSLRSSVNTLQSNYTSLAARVAALEKASTT